MIKEIEAKVLLSHVKQPDPWFGLKYNMNLYRGCQHQCIYCDSRSDCYQIENFSDILVKANALELLQAELSRKRVKGTIGTGSMNDPYMPLEAEIRLTGRALDLIAKYQFGVHVITKSDLVLRDIKTLEKIKRKYAAVSFTLTTVDDNLAKKLEPAAPPPSARLKAMQELSKQEIYTGVVMMPILPFIEDNEDNIKQIVSHAYSHGAEYIIPSFGVTLRSGSRDYYYKKLDHLYPGLKARYDQQYGESYYCVPDNVHHLNTLFLEMCEKYRIQTRLNPYAKSEGNQLKLL